MGDLTNFPMSPQPGDDKPVSQSFDHRPVTARVPERLSRGVLSTGHVVLDSPKEFCIDFFQGLARPFQVVSRVVLSPQTMGEFATALEQNLGAYSQQYGTAPVGPPPPAQANKPSIQEIYEHFKLPEEMMGGAYANGVLISHSGTEFCFDFIAGFYPTPAVVSRVMVAAPQATRLLATLRKAVEQFNQRYRGGTPLPPAGPPGTPPTPPEPPAKEQ